MVTTSTALLAFLQANQPFFSADLYTFTLIDGTVLNITSFDRPILYSGVTYQSSGPYISRSSIKLSNGLTASVVKVVIQDDPTDMLESQSVLLDIAQGKFSNGTVSIRRAYMTAGDVAAVPAICNLTGAATGQGDGTILRFVGVVGTVSEVNTLTATLEVRDQLYVLNRPCPKLCFQPGCVHSFCDTGCALNVSDFTYTGTVQTGSTFLTINTNLTQDTGALGPPSTPSLSLVNQASLPWNGYYVETTYISKFGETLPSPQAFIAASPNHLLIVTSPGAVTGATGWNCYVGNGAGNEQLQNSLPIAIGTAYDEPPTGIVQTGIVAPLAPTTGFWALGRITFTSGALQGITSYITGSNDSGQIFLAAPLPSAPASGVTFSITSGCDKSVGACSNRTTNASVLINNTEHFMGVPSAPVPEIGSA